MKLKPFSIKELLRSFRYAFNGLKVLIAEEHNARIHMVITVVVIGVGLYFRLSAGEWTLVLLCMALVFSMELINSAIENLADFISPEQNEQIKRVKDLSAAAVLVSAIIAAIVGLIVFLPKFFFNAP
jgi:diacylglycerol kinase